MADELPGFERDELEKFIEEYMELNRKAQRPQGIYSILSGSREAKYQDTLQYFLEPQKPHGFGHTLLDNFLKAIEFHDYNLPGQHIEIEDEVPIKDDGADGLIDLVIAGGSALDNHPQWAVFLELKVGASEGTEQTVKYADTEFWNFSWFDSSKLSVSELDTKRYVYLKLDDADNPKADDFEPVAWSEIVESFEVDVQDSIFEYPNRSVIQFTDFIQSLKEAEGMDSSINVDELNERLTLYFEHSDVIQKVEKANSQFESDFEDISTYLQANWEDEIATKYDFENSGWQTGKNGVQYQKIFPSYWKQVPSTDIGEIQIYFRHSPVTDQLRDQTLRFRLRLPKARNSHTDIQESGNSFNEMFAEKCTGEYADRIQNVIGEIGVDDARLGDASALVEKDYPLNQDNLVNSYFDQLDTAVEEFCSRQSELPGVINEVFERVYQSVFEEDPEGEFPGGLPKKTS